MKLSFEIEKQTALAQTILIDSIISQLADSNYKTLTQTQNEVMFDDSNTFFFASNFEKIKRVDKGRFEIISVSDKRIIKLASYISITWEVILISATTLGGIFYDYAILFFSFVFLLIFLMRVQMAKSGCQELLNNIAG